MIALYYEVADLFIIVAIVYGIWRNMRTSNVSTSLPSAYSVFNKGGERLVGDGTGDVDGMLRRGGL